MPQKIKRLKTDEDDINDKKSDVNPHQRMAPPDVSSFWVRRIQ